jgi:predicted dehydrogenase
MTSGVLGSDDVARIGVIGCGGRGSADLGELVKVPHARVVAVCELRDDRLAKAKGIAHKTKPNGYKDFRKMMEKEKLDGVTAVVEVQNHAKVIVPILEAGLNCFSEKPMDQTVERVDAMVKAARKNNRWIQVGFQRRYIPGHRKVLEEIHSGKLGKIYALQGQWHFQRVPSWLNADEGGGRLVEQACHHLDTMSWVLKNAAPLRCIAMGMPMPNPGANPPKHLNEFKSAVAFEFADDVLFTYTHLFGMPGPMGDGSSSNQSGEKLWVAAEKGGYDISSGMRYMLGGSEGEQIAEPSKGYSDGTYEEFASFARCLQTGELPAANHEIARVSTFMALMGRMAMYNRETRSFTPRLIHWEDLGSTL